MPEFSCIVLVIQVSMSEKEAGDNLSFWHFNSNFSRNLTFYSLQILLLSWWVSTKRENLYFKWNKIHRDFGKLKSFFSSILVNNSMSYVFKKRKKKTYIFTKKNYPQFSVSVQKRKKPLQELHISKCALFCSFFTNFL